MPRIFPWCPNLTLNRMTDFITYEMDKRIRKDMGVRQAGAVWKIVLGGARNVPKLGLSQNNLYRRISLFWGAEMQSQWWNKNPTEFNSLLFWLHSVCDGKLVFAPDVVIRILTFSNFSWLLSVTCFAQRIQAISETTFCIILEGLWTLWIVCICLRVFNIFDQ